jgi:hypothetical protein
VAAMGRLSVPLLGAAALIAAMGASAAVGQGNAPHENVWQRLHRPLHIPRLPPGSHCRTSRPDRKGDLSRIGFAGTAWGSGPVYPGGLGSRRPVLRFALPAPPTSDFYGSEWSGNKVLWMIARARRGPVLIRGRQVDGPNEVRFERGTVPGKELRIPGRRWGRSSRGGGSRASYTRVRAPGCYAYQVDGLRFSKVIFFAAVADVPGGPARVALVRALGVAGLTVEPEETSGPDLDPFGVVGYFYTAAGGGSLDVYEFPEDEAAASAAAKVSPDGYQICGPGWCMEEFTIGPPRWFRRGALLVQYIGSDPAMLAALTGILGPPFAGQA